MEQKDIVAYLEARLAETDKRPDIHTHSRKEYIRLLTIAKNEPEIYARAAGNMFEVLKAEELDRQQAFLDLYTRLENPYRVKAHRAILEAVGSSTNHSEIWQKKSEAMKQVQQDMDKHHTIRACLMELISSIVSYMRTTPVHKEKFTHNIRKYWVEFKTLDPELSWQKISIYSPYRDCLYYDEERMVLLGKVLQEVLSEL